MLCTALYCTALHCTVLHCTVLYCTVLYCTELYYTVQYSTALYRTVLYCTVLYCTAHLNAFHDWLGLPSLSLFPCQYPLGGLGDPYTVFEGLYRKAVTASPPPLR